MTRHGTGREANDDAAENDVFMRITNEDDGDVYDGMD